MSDEAAAPATPEATPAENSGSAKPTPAAAPAEYEFDFEGQKRKYSAEELRANYLKGKSAAQLMSKAEQRAREADEKLKRAEATPQRFRDRAERAKILKEWGLDERQLAEELLLPYVQAETLNEDQRRALEYQRRNEELERQAKEREDKEKADKEEEETRAHQERLGKAFVAALDKVGLPKESAPWAIKRMAALAEKAEDLGLELAPEEIAGLVREDFLNEHRSITATLSGAQIEALYGEDFIKKVMRYAVEKLRKGPKPGQLNQTPAPGVTPTQKPNGVHKPPKKTMNEAEFDQYVKQLTKGG